MRFMLALHLYRPLMRLAHRFNWHYAPEIGPLAPDGTYQKWCKWCGLRMSYRKGTPHDIFVKRHIRGLDLDAAPHIECEEPEFPGHRRIF